MKYPHLTKARPKYGPSRPSAKDFLIGCLVGKPKRKCYFLEPMVEATVYRYGIKVNGHLTFIVYASMQWADSENVVQNILLP